MFDIHRTTANKWLFAASFREVLRGRESGRRGRTGDLRLEKPRKHLLSQRFRGARWPGVRSRRAEFRRIGNTRGTLRARARGRTAATPRVPRAPMPADPLSPGSVGLRGCLRLGVVRTLPCTNSTSSGAWVWRFCSRPRSASSAKCARRAAGLRTYTLVGVGSAVFMLVSIFGFADVVGQPHVSLDPSRVAAQIVSGIGFIGGGIIFVRRDTVRGLTTAAGAWVTAAVGMACGGDLPIIAVATTLVYFIVAYIYPELVRRLPRSRDAPSDLRLVYLDGHGILREALAECARRGFSISDLSIKHNGVLETDGHTAAVVTVELEVRGRGPLCGARHRAQRDARNRRRPRRRRKRGRY